MYEKLLLISIGDHTNNSNIGIDQIAHYLRNLCDVSLLVENLYIDYSELGKSGEILPLEYDLYGFSVNCININSAFRLAEEVKRAGKTVVFGGLFAGIMHFDIFEESQSVDYIICGDGEVPMSFLIVNLQADQKKQIDEYPFISTRNNYKTKKLQHYRNCNVDVGFADDYFVRKKPTLHGYEITIMLKSNVCSHYCTFCHSPKTENGFLFRDPDKVINLIEKKRKIYPVTHVYFTDNDVFDGNYPLHGLNYMQRICDAIQQSDIQHMSFHCSTRVDASCFKPQHAHILTKMKETGLAYLFLGVESGNDEDLKLYGKGATKQDNIVAVRTLMEFGIQPVFGFIMINPYSDLNRLSENYQFLQESQSASIRNYARSQLAIEKYSAIYKKVLCDGLLLDTYSYIDNYQYRFLHAEIQPINDFLVKRFIEDEAVGGSFDPVYDLLIYYAILSAQRPELRDFSSAVEVLKRNFINGLEFFRPLFQLGDVAACEKRFSQYKKDLLQFKADAEVVKRRIFAQYAKIVKRNKQGTHYLSV